MYTVSYQMYKCEHGLTTAAEQRAADVRAGEAAAALAVALQELRLSLGRVFRAGHRAQPARGAADTAARVLSASR
jgi:hypothetical protein